MLDVVGLDGDRPVIALLISLGLTGCLFVAAWLFAMEGVRAGDRPGNTTVSAVGVDGDGMGIPFTVHNRGGQAVLLGASLRRHSLRLWQSNASYISVPCRTARGGLLPGEHALVCVVEPDDRMGWCASRRPSPSPVARSWSSPSASPTGCASYTEP